MKIGIIGPNKLFRGNLEERKSLLNRTAKTLADSKQEIILTPDKDSLLEYFGISYKKHGGKNILLIIPTEEPDHKSYLNTELGEIISCKDWYRQANEFNRQSDIFVCLGYSWGTMKEIACANYFNKKKIYIIKEFILEKLPEELNYLVEYVSLGQLKEAIDKS